MIEFLEIGGIGWLLIYDPRATTRLTFLNQLLIFTLKYLYDLLVELKLIKVTSNFEPYNCWKFRVKLSILPNWIKMSPIRSGKKSRKKLQWRKVIFVFDALRCLFTGNTIYKHGERERVIILTFLCRKAESLPTCERIFVIDFSSLDDRSTTVETYYLYTSVWELKMVKL